jgi:hypothetical protein
VKHTEPRPPRLVAAVATLALLSSGALACGAPRASGKAGPAAAPPGVVAGANRTASVAAGGHGAGPDPGESRAAPSSVQTRPVVLVMPSGEAYLVLGLGPDPRSGADVWSVVYVAGDDPGALELPETRARLASMALDVVGALHPLAELANAERLSVAALFGKPRASGAVELRWYARDGGRWSADGSPRRYAVEQVPAFDGQVVRDRDEEAAARGAAADFMSDARRADYDAAWERTSAFAKATMSRAEFDRHVAAMRSVDATGDAALYLSFPATDRFLPGAFVEAWLAPDAADGSGVQALTLRLDDDMEWRVAGVVDVSSAPSPPALGSPREDPVASRPGRSLTP